MDKQEQQGICREIGARTGGDIYIGVVGPVRSGKSTFIKRFMEQLVLPAMGTESARRTQSSGPGMSCRSRRQDAPS